MNQYYYLGTDGQQNGPVPAESLKENGVTTETYVWCEGMANWEKVAEVEELAPLFAPPAPPTPPTPPAAPVPPAPQPAPAPAPAPQPTPAAQPTQPNQPNQPNQPLVCPDNYLVWSILATILCCWPLGIPAIINATKVDKLWAQGDKAGAVAKSEEAKKWCFISLGGGLLAFLFYFFVGFAGAL